MASQRVLAEEIVSIVPHPSLFASLGRSNFTLTYALGEFIDNAYDARGNVSPVKVAITLDDRKRQISVEDNAQGMSRDGLVVALTVGAVSPKGPRAIGMFGLGLKAAATFLADRFSIETTPVEGPYTFRASFDKQVFDSWNLSIQSLVKSPDHGTLITLHSVHAPMNREKIWGRKGRRGFMGIAQELAEVYHRLIQSGRLTLVIDGTPLPAPERAVKDSARWEIDFDIAGLRVRGWVGATHTWSEGGLRDYTPGFCLIRHDRVVKKGEWLGVKQHPTVRAMVGELDLDGFPVNNNKTDFLRDTREWAQLIAHLEDFFGNQEIRQAIYHASEARSTGDDRDSENLSMESVPPGSAPETVHAIAAPGTAPREEPKPADNRGPSAIPEGARLLESPAERPRVFIVHGQDAKALEQCESVIRELGLESIVLEDRPGLGIVALLEKFETSVKQSDFAVALLTPDDMGWSPAEGETSKNAKPRARQNVVFEFGYFVRWSKKKTVCLYKEKSGLVLPTDLLGIHYLGYKKDVREAKEKLRMELVGARMSTSACF